MNILFNTQSIGIHVFWKLYREMVEDDAIELGKVGFFVTNKDEFDRFAKTTPEFTAEVNGLLSEWDILKDSRDLREVDFSYIEEWEKRIGDASLWNAIICDRRFNYGVRAQFVQDYQPSYDHETLLKVLQSALMRIEAHMKEVRPDAVVSLNAVTLYDYLYYLMATKRGIPYFQLKLTRIENYVSLYTNPLGISPHIGDRISNYIAAPDQLRKNPELIDEATEFLASSRGGSLSYEGAISKNKNAKLLVSKSSGASTATKKGMLSRIAATALGAHQDDHYPSQRASQWYTRVIKPCRRSVIERVVFSSTNRNWEEKLSKYKYAVYPLNTEPEVALLVYGRSYRNQIETVRNIAGSLPVGWKLAVKEHPNSLGYRNIGYYKKLQEIPNVVLLGPSTDTARLVSDAELVFVVFGTIGLEAILKKKPLITLCPTPYSSFPQHMVLFVENWNELGTKVKEILEEYEYDEWALISYIAAHIEESIRINLFTEMLGKANRNIIGKNISLRKQYKELGRYLMNRIKEEKNREKR